MSSKISDNLPDTLELNNENYSLYDDLICTLEKITALLTLERNFIDINQISKIADINDEKIRLSDKIGNINHIIKTSPHIFSDLSQEEKNRLLELNTLFSELAEYNMNKLTQAIMVNQKIIDSFKRQITNSRKHESLYGKSGENNVGLIDNLTFVTEDIA